MYKCEFETSKDYRDLALLVDIGAIYSKVVNWSMYKWNACFTDTRWKIMKMRVAEWPRRAAA